MLFLCDNYITQRTPGDLSVLLLTELKEILKTYCQSPAGIKNSKKSSHGYAKVGDYIVAFAWATLNIKLLRSLSRLCNNIFNSH